MQFLKLHGIATIYLGRIAFPLFAFMIVEGYNHTSDLKKYITRLGIFAIISQVPYMLFMTLVIPDSNKIEVNVIVTLLLGLLAIMLVDKSKNKIIGFLGAISLIIIAKYINCDYKWYGVGMVLLIYLLKDKKILFFITYICYVIFYFYITYLKDNMILLKRYIPFIFTSILPIVFMLLYNGKRGPKLKYFFYIFYPLHLIVIFFIGQYLNV